MRLALALLLAAGCTPTLSQPRGEEHLDAMARARRHHHHGRIEEAADAWADAARHAERRVDRDEASYRRAQALERMERLPEAIAIYDEIAQRRPVSRRTARALFEASLLRLERGDDAGEDGLLRLVRQHPDAGPSSRALRVLLSRYEERGQDPLPLLQRLYAEVGDRDIGDDLLVAEADLRIAREDRAGAVTVLERVVEEHPYPHGQRWDDALWRLADLAEAGGDPQRAVAYLQRMVSVHEWTSAPGSYTLPLFPQAQLRIARLYRDELGDLAAAEDAFVTVYEEFPSSTLRDDALLDLAELRFATGRTVEACATLRMLIEHFEVGHPRRRARAQIARRC